MKNPVCMQRTEGGQQNKEIMEPEEYDAMMFSLANWPRSTELFQICSSLCSWFRNMEAFCVALHLHRVCMHAWKQKEASAAKNPQETTRSHCVPPHLPPLALRLPSPLLQIRMWRRKESEKKERKKQRKNGRKRGRQRPLNIKVLWVLEKLVVFIPTFPLSDVFSIAEQRLGKQRQTDSALDSELVLA